MRERIRRRGVVRLSMTLQAHMTRDELKAGIVPKLKLVDKQDTDTQTEESMFETAAELLDKIFESL